MPISDLHAKVATLALEAAAEHGFALGGGNALLAHGIINRRTEDVDLFTNREHGVEAATGGVETALHRAGFRTDRIDKTAGLGDIFGEEMGQGLAEWAVTAPSGEKMALQMAYFDRGREPVIMEIGPVLDLEDVAGGKVCAAASRTYERDYVDVAAMLDHYTPEQLISFAHRLDPGLTGTDYADTAQRLDRLSERRFAEFGLSPEEVSALRERFTVWPRDPEQIDRQIQDHATAAEQTRSGTEQTPGLAAQLERGEQSAQHLQAHRTERAADDQQRAHDQARGQDRSTGRDTGRDAPEIEP
jgi:nucleotidyltransferase AbiEii toxin of type IV toxin-antitoxin system